MESFPAGTPTLAVVRDGGFLYNVAELASAHHNGLAAKLLLVDDDGYGVLREYQRSASGETFAVELVQAYFTALATTLGLPVRSAGPENLADDLAWGLDVEAPAAVLLSA
jgi:acetolactate synthase-1/2/3 large subunit